MCDGELTCISHGSPPPQEIAREKCGLSALMGAMERSWQDMRYLLGYFGRTSGRAKKEYISFMEQGIARLEISPPAVRYSVERGQAIARENGYYPIEQFLTFLPASPNRHTLRLDQSSENCFSSMIFKMVRSVSIIPSVVRVPIFFMVASGEALMMPSVDCTLTPCKANNAA